MPDDTHERRVREFNQYEFNMRAARKSLALARDLRLLGSRQTGLEQLAAAGRARKWASLSKEMSAREF